MQEQRLHELLARFAQQRILVIGDFFLDKYLVLDDALTETSLETGQAAYQVVAKRLAPGAAGTVTANLLALGAGEVLTLGGIGDDGEGKDLLAALQRLGATTEPLLVSDKLMTPTYLKPMLRDGGTEQELTRFDTINRTPCPEALETYLLDQLESLAPTVQAIIVSDQVQGRNRGMITDRVRAGLTDVARRYPSLFLLADSRCRIGEFDALWVKPNRKELLAALQRSIDLDPTIEAIADQASGLVRRNERPVFVTLAEHGILVVEQHNASRVPTLQQPGPIDVCGAGDSTMAGIALSLCAGATPVEAAVVGNLVASITVQQLGVTGTATPDAVRSRYREAGGQFIPESVATQSITNMIFE